MVNDNLPPVAPFRDSVSKSDDTVSATAASSVDLSSRKDSDLAQSLKNQTGPSLNFLQGFSLDMGADTALTMSGTDSGELNDRSSDTAIKDDVYRSNDRDGRDPVRDDVYRFVDHDGSEAVTDDVYRSMDYKPNGTAKQLARVSALARATYAATSDSQPAQPMDQPPQEIRSNGNHPAGGGGDDTGGKTGADPKPTPAPDSEPPRTTDPQDHKRQSVFV